MVRYRGTDTLRLQATDIKVKLLWCQVQVNENLHRDLALKMERGVVSYPTVRSEIRT